MTNRKGRLPEKATSFHGRNNEAMVGKLIRPKTLPELLSGNRNAGKSQENKPKLTKLLLNVNIQRSLGPVMTIMSSENTVNDLIAAALKQYAKEGRRPFLPSVDPADFGLHYSQFSLESLDRYEKLIVLGSRNFFLCPKPLPIENDDDATSNSCSKQAEKNSKSRLPWLKIIDFMF